MKSEAGGSGGSSGGASGRQVVPGILYLDHKSKNSKKVDFFVSLKS